MFPRDPDDCSPENLNGYSSFLSAFSGDAVPPGEGVLDELMPHSGSLRAPPEVSAAPSIRSNVDDRIKVRESLSISG
jgi:hypothetical protein